MYKLVRNALLISAIGFSAMLSNGAQAQTFSVLYSFSGPRGISPQARMVPDLAGNLYGTTEYGGTFGHGTVFKFNIATGHVSVLHSFAGAPDGSEPLAGLVRDDAGNFYGTTYAGGTSVICSGGCGTLFKLDRSGAETVLYSFQRGTDGANPISGLILDAVGNLYGTTYAGGNPSCLLGPGCGTVFKFDTFGVETILYAFSGGSDGSQPYYAALVQDLAGNLYGTTGFGGDFSSSECSLFGCGTVFKLAGDGTKTTLHSFTGMPDGREPVAGLIRDAAGNLYGTTYGGGQYDDGTVFMLDTGGSESVLHNFTSTPDGMYPWTSLIGDAKGNLYGTTIVGGTRGYGTVFKLDPTGTETLLHSFLPGRDGAGPYGGSFRDATGNLYGTTPDGGPTGYGTVYKISP